HKVGIGVAALGVGWLVYRWVQQPRVGGDGRIQISGRAWVNIPFAFDSAQIPPESHTELERIAALIRGEPGLSILIRGHTDNAGSDEYNIELGAERAMSVYYWLIDAGVERSRLSFESAGESEPVADNATAAGRALNRRVEFVVV
ncbi:MAG: OmpA family protein, partial [Planctomycetota bacterium]